MSRKSPSQTSNLKSENLPYGTFSDSKSHHDQKLETIVKNEAGRSKSNIVNSFNNSVSPTKESQGEEAQLVEVSINPDSDSDSSMHFGDTSRLIDDTDDVDVEVDKSLSKKCGDGEDLSPKSKSGILRFLYDYRGILLTLATSLSVSIASVFAKYIISMDYAVSVSLFWRSPIIVVFGILEIFYHVFYTRKPIFSTIWPCDNGDNRKTFIILVLCRGIMGPLAILTQFYAFKYLELGDAQTIIYSNAVFVTFFAHFMLGESWGIVPFLAAIVTILGVMIISKPPFITGSTMEFTSDRVTGLVLALCAMLLNTFIFILLRFLKNVNSSIPIFMMALMTMLLGLVLSIWNDEFSVPHSREDIGAFLGMAIFTTVGAITLTLALQYEEAGLVSLVRCADVIFSFLLQMAIGVFPDWYSVGGTLIVLSCMLVVFLRKYLVTLPSDSALVKKLWFLLK